MRLLAGIAALVLSSQVLACGAFLRPPDVAVDAIALDWARPLYELESFASQAQELGRPLLLEGRGYRGGGILVVPSADRTVRGLNARSGEVLWTLSTLGRNEARPAAGGGMVYVPSLDGHLYALEPSTGVLRWKSDIIGRGGLVTTPVYAEGEDGVGRVFVTASDNRLIAFEATSGRYLWDRHRKHATELTITGQAGATVHGGMVLTAFSDGMVGAYAQEDGATLWAVEISGENRDFLDVDTTPVVVGDRVFIAGYRSGLHALDLKTGAEHWLLTGEAYGEPLVFDGLLYLPQADGRLFAVDPSSGELQWSLNIRSGTPGTPAASRKYLWVPVGGSLLVCDRQTGRVVTRVHDEQGFSATPEYAWGVLYAQGNSGTIYALAVH